ncbi:MAG: MarR family EPS-associated transcriptional regulator [Candidatus Competibacter sp.]|nr:MarR family EPS-associated transcriptional regulator [Candidatus Contendobacter sp.]MDS4042011.1 MarR family EPS-associated transcriptional regulator [Candidatus Competibacter sp.]MDS4068177.1 MarR family EPS-associated transcriptional regulator [Candidatus Competibacter sp.]
MSHRQDNQREDIRFQVLRLLEANPRITQRELARELGISLGWVNYCLKALLDKGLIKIHNFSANPNKLAYAYRLTPAGLAEKAVITTRFLKRKLAEYERLREEIEFLRREVSEGNRDDGGQGSGGGV